MPWSSARTRRRSAGRRPAPATYPRRPRRRSPSRSSASACRAAAETPPCWRGADRRAAPATGPICPPSPPARGRRRRSRTRGRRRSARRSRPPDPRATSARCVRSAGHHVAGQRVQPLRPVQREDGDAALDPDSSSSLIAPANPATPTCRHPSLPPCAAAGTVSCYRASGNAREAVHAKAGEPEDPHHGRRIGHRPRHMRAVRARGRHGCRARSRRGPHEGGACHCRRRVGSCQRGARGCGRRPACWAASTAS